MKILAIDVGTGTQDILLFDSTTQIENCLQMVMPSPTVLVANQIKDATAKGDTILLTGAIMGGGPDRKSTRLNSSHQERNLVCRLLLE